MKEKVILIIVLVVMVLLIGGAVFLLNSNTLYDYAKENMENLQDDKLNSSGDENIESGDKNLQNGEKDSDLVSGEHIEEVTINNVTDDNFESEVLKSNQTVVVDFYADWCGPCKILAPTLQEFANENPDIKVVKLNVDENENTAMNFSVYSIPTLVVIKDGVETNRLVGVNSKENIKMAVDFVKE